MVGNANGTDFVFGEHNHGLPSVDYGDGVFDNDISAFDGAVLNEGEVFVTGLEGDRPVNKVELTMVINHARTGYGSGKGEPTSR